MGTSGNSYVYPAIKDDEINRRSTLFSEAFFPDVGNCGDRPLPLDAAGDINREGERAIMAHCFSTSAFPPSAGSNNAGMNTHPLCCESSFAGAVPAAPAGMEFFHR